MKEGDYLIPKNTFNRTLYTVKRDQNNNILEVKENGIITFKEKTKYKITKIFSIHNIPLAEIIVDNKTVSFSLKICEQYEHVNKLFYLDNAISLRTEKLKQINKIAKLNKFKNIFQL